MIRKRYVFSGQVQHVGFRWRARRAAEMFGCTGWCRNNPDGTVTMEIQGPDAKIRLVLLAIRAGSRIRIGETKVTVLSLVPEEKDFCAKY